MDTHHAQQPDSLPDPHADLRWFYPEDLRDFIHAWGPDLWVHGHVHDVVDYTVGPTQIVSNPRGHVEEATGFDPRKIVALVH